MSRGREGGREGGRERERERERERGERREGGERKGVGKTRQFCSKRKGVEMRFDTTLLKQFCSKEG